jgi:HAD superfamily hydrolase (TIGR01549 family)
MTSIAILDVDGTLVDTNYQHALAWFRAFHGHGLVLPIWRIHRHIGMGGDQIVEALCGEEVERRAGEEIREAEKELYATMVDEVQPMDQARELIARLAGGNCRVVLASSAREEEVDHYLDLLEARDLVHAWTTSEDVEQTKPKPDLVAAALERGGGHEGVMVGDSSWDCEAARRAGVPSIGVLTGGFAEAELLEHGASAVFASLAELCEGLEQTPLGAFV